MDFAPQGDSGLCCPSVEPASRKMEVAYRGAAPATWAVMLSLLAMADLAAARDLRQFMVGLSSRHLVPDCSCLLSSGSSPEGQAPAGRRSRSAAWQGKVEVKNVHPWKAGDAMRFGRT
jgi:hypothetical protein